jgi:aquaporin Z
MAKSHGAGAYLAEFLGTFFFIYAILVSGGNPLIIGGALALVVYLIAGVSGAAVNPAVSLAMLIQGQLAVGEWVGYAAAELAGAAGAVYLRNWLGGGSLLA